MALNSEEAIYKITRVVYEHLGDKLERPLVEALITDIFANLKTAFEPPEKLEKIVKPISNQTKRAVEPSIKAQHYIISVFGLDRPGIVAAIAAILSEANCNIIDMNQTVVQDKFAMIMIINAVRATQDMAQLREAFRQAGESLGVKVYLQREDIFQAMHRV